MKLRLPIIPTFVVAVAVAIMIALGFWQLDRAHQKDAAMESWQANMDLPVTAYPVQNATDEQYRFRRLSANCLRVVDWKIIGGRSVDGQSGWKHVAYCTTGAEGPGLVVDMGVSKRPDVQADWQGGPVTGYATLEPDNSGMVDRMIGRSSPLRLMIVADTPAPGLAASASPDPASVPNNHRSYMVQWFLFALIAVVIYGLALHKRQRGEAQRD